MANQRVHFWETAKKNAPGGVAVSRGQFTMSLRVMVAHDSFEIDRVRRQYNANPSSW